MCVSRQRDTTVVAQSFLSWGITVVDAVATLLEAEIPDGRRGNRSSLPDYEAVYVHFRDAKIPQSLAVWLYATREGAAYNVGGRTDVIGIGLKHDANDELDRGAWRFRPLTPFSWSKHIDQRWEGFRWLWNAADPPGDPHQASTEIAERVHGVLRRVDAIPPSR